MWLELAQRASDWLHAAAGALPTAAVPWCPARALAFLFHSRIALFSFANVASQCFTETHGKGQPRPFDQSRPILNRAGTSGLKLLFYMKTLLIIAGAFLVALIGAAVLLARNHKQWLERQTPAGVWQATDGQTKITLQFEGGPREGTYKQLMESDGKEIREFGHWAATANVLKMMIMATDVQSHPRFGIDTEYHISYVGPTNIKIDGPDRAGIVYAKASVGNDVKFDTKSEPQR